MLARFLEDSSLGHDIRLAAFLLLRDPLQVWQVWQMCTLVRLV